MQRRRSQGYSVLRQSQNLGGGGGILLYVKNKLKAKVLHTLKNTQQGKPLKLEYIFCGVWEECSPPTLIVLVYRPPDVPIRSHKQLVRLLCSACSDQSHKIIMRDWIADTSAQHCSKSRFMRELMADLSLKLVGLQIMHLPKTLGWASF